MFGSGGCERLLLLLLLQEVRATASSRFRIFRAPLFSIFFKPTWGGRGRGRGGLGGGEGGLRVPASAVISSPKNISRRDEYQQASAEGDRQPELALSCASDVKRSS